MNITRTIGRIAAVLAAVAALTALAGVAQAQTSRPPGMSSAEYEALMLRSEALNQEYGLGSPAAVDVPSEPTDSTGDFAWGAFGIGAAAMFGLGVVAGGFVVRHRHLATRRGLTPQGTA